MLQGRCSPATQFPCHSVPPPSQAPATQKWWSGCTCTSATRPLGPRELEGPVELTQPRKSWQRQQRWGAPVAPWPGGALGVAQGGQSPEAALGVGGGAIPRSRLAGWDPQVPQSSRAGRPSPSSSRGWQLPPDPACNVGDQQVLTLYIVLWPHQSATVVTVVVAGPTLWGPGRECLVSCE